MSSVSVLPRRELTGSRLAVSELSLGCSQLGNLYREVSDEDARATVDSAWGLGIRYYDTAPHYGLGLSERRLGAALAGRSRADYVLSTKVGRLLEPIRSSRRPSTTRASRSAPPTGASGTSAATGFAARSRRASRRLGVERVDIVYLHDPDDHWDDVIESGYPALWPSFATRASSGRSGPE